MMNDDRIATNDGNDEDDIPSPDFQVGDICVITEPVKRTFFTISEGTVVEIKRRFPKQGQLCFDVITLPCKSCNLVVKVKDVPIISLEDYEISNPSFV